MTAENKLILYVQESLFESILADCFTAAILVGAIGTGVLLDSAAMQWAGFIAFWLWVIVGRQDRVTPQEAANRIRDEYGVVAEPKETGAPPC